MSAVFHAPSRLAASLASVAFLTAGLACAGTASAADANARLRDTRWTLQTLDGQPAAAAAKGKSAYLVLRGKSQHVEGSGGCNRLRGRFTQRGTELALRALATTRMACTPELMQQEKRLLDTLAATDSYRIEGQVLSLLQGDVVKVTFSTAKAR